MPAKVPGWGLLTRRSDPTRTATELYGRLVAHARSPAFYAEMGVPDTPEGRFELLLLHMVLMLRRLQRDAPGTLQLARALSETFVVDMDDCMREMGVGDLTVAKKVKKAAAALFDRSRDYGKALDLGDADKLAQLIAAHIMPDQASGPALPPGARQIATHARASDGALTKAPLAAILDGTVILPSLGS